MRNSAHTVGITQADQAPLHAARDGETTHCGRQHSQRGRRAGVRCGRPGSRSIGGKACLKALASQGAR